MIMSVSKSREETSGEKSVIDRAGTEGQDRLDTAMEELEEKLVGMTTKEQQATQPLVDDLAFVRAKMDSLYIFMKRQEDDIH